MSTYPQMISAICPFNRHHHSKFVVISDFKMPGLNGIEFLKKIKDSNPFVRTILMTAFEIEDRIFREYTKRKIINAFIQKPVGIHDLIKEVNTQLEYYEQQKKYPSS
jgi:two-component system NtrC family sensor kinase